MMHAETKDQFDVSDEIVAFKRKMAPRRAELKRAFDDVKSYVGRASDTIQKNLAAGRPNVPELDYKDIKAGKISDATRKAIRQSGCAVVRGVFPASQATDSNATGCRELPVRRQPWLLPCSRRDCRRSRVRRRPYLDFSEFERQPAR